MRTFFTCIDIVTENVPILTGIAETEYSAPCDLPESILPAPRLALESTHIG